MAKKKTDGTEAPAAQRVIIRAKDASGWQNLLREAAEQHWRTIRVEIQIRDRILGGKPSSLDAAQAMLKARGMDDFVAQAEDIVDPTARAAEAARIAQDEGKCEFSRRTDKPGIYIPSNNIKAGLKENWSVLGFRNQVRGSRGAMAEGMFVVGPGNTVDSDWIYIAEKPDGVQQSVAHTTGPSGPIAAIKRNEFVIRPKLVFDIMIANANAVSDKIGDDELAKTLVHMAEHGVGANRSQGYGKFDIIGVAEIQRS